MDNDTFKVPKLRDLAEVQRASFCWLLEQGLAEEINNFSPIIDGLGDLELHFLGDKYKLKSPKYNLAESKRRDISYSVQLYIPVRLINRETNTTKEKEIYFGDLPLMTDRGTFVINGSERVVINQIVRSPGIYYQVEMDIEGKRTYSGTLISNRGPWIKFEIDEKDLMWVHLDKTKKLLAHIFLKALGLNDYDIYNGLRRPTYLAKTYYEGKDYTTEKALIEFYSKLRPGESPTMFNARELLYSRFFDPKKYDLGKVGRYKLNTKLNIEVPDYIQVLTPQDILGAIDYLINLKFGIGSVDDIDHLANRRIRSVGELLQNQIRIGLSKLEKIVRDRMLVDDTSFLTPSNLISSKPIITSMREFFGSNQLSQFMDQTNPLSELTHKRRISSLGPGGVTRDRAGFAMRDIHPSHYGRICPIETPEGPNAGLVGVLALYAIVDFYGFIATPFNKIVDGKEIIEPEPTYLTADEEDDLRIAPGDIITDNEGYLQGHQIPVKYKQEFITAPRHLVDYKAVSPIQVISIATSLIPFLEHNDANRTLMGSNMQRQAVPLIHPERPLISTGLEAQVARDSAMVIVNIHKGKVSYVTSNEIYVMSDEGRETLYHLHKYQRSNQDTCMNQKATVWLEDNVESGEIIADGSSTVGGELALGQNVFVAYVPWEGYNYEDAILISERLVYNDLYTSIHIEKHETEARITKFGPEEVTRKLPNTSEYLLRKLDEKGIIMIGSWVEPGDILIGKLTPQEEADQPPEIKLLRNIFGEKPRDIRDSSLRVPNGGKGRVVDVRIFSREKGDELPAGSTFVAKVFIAQTRRIQVGDKMSGRHGNKGIISRILPREDMPYLPDGTPIDIVLNPLGVPSRMNVGQIFECLLGLAAEYLDKRFYIIPFDEMYGAEASRILITNSLIEAKKTTNKNWLFNIAHPGKMTIFDGRTGEKFDNPVTVGISYMLKLVHLVDDKMHARSTGPYALVTQQPLGGKAKHGGQRLGEMEVWALEAFGAAYTLQELLTVKSDDMQGRNDIIKSIVKGKPMPTARTPESFKVLIRELQSLGLDVGPYKIGILSDGQKIGIEVELMPPNKKLRYANTIKD